MNADFLALRSNNDAILQSSRGDCPSVELLAGMVDAFVAAVLDLPPAQLDALAATVAPSALREAQSDALAYGEASA